MRLFLLTVVTLLLASCTPSASPQTQWDYSQNEPGGIQVSGPGTYEDMLGEQTPAEACASLGSDAFPPGYCEGLNGGSSPTSGNCDGDAAFELFPPGPAWIARCK